MTRPAPPRDPLSDRLAGCYSGVLHDVMRAAGLRNFVLPPTLRPLEPGPRMAGPVFTVSGRATTADPHETLLAWTGLLSRAPAGHVLVIQPHDRELAFMGELSAETLQFKGLRGALVDGGCRDVEFILELGFPVWATHYTPRDIVGAWLPTEFDQPLQIGDVQIAPGDYLCADRDGALRVPRAQAAELVEQAEQAMAKESLVRKAILEGLDPQQAYLRHGKF
ncbi:MAG: RraA family protein [Burkholderiales bacterium]|nr:RraA family protein [Burkholderiales bacterium]MDE2454867.1 RraA family protein [Burkholderiales bacterium]